MALDFARIVNLVGLIFKVLELMLSIVIWAIYADSANFVHFYDIHGFYLGLTTAGAYTIICFALITLYKFSVPHHVYELVVLAVGAILNAVVFLIGLRYYIKENSTDKLSTLIVSSMAGICSIVMAFCTVIWSFYTNDTYYLGFSSDGLLYLGLITSGGYTIICATLIICYFFNEKHSLHEMILLPIGAGLSLAVGIAGAVQCVKFPKNGDVTGILIVTVMAFCCCITMVLDFLREFWYGVGMKKCMKKNEQNVNE